VLRSARVIPLRRNEQDALTDRLPLEDARIADRVLWLDAVMAQEGSVEGLSLRAVIIRMVR